MGQSIQLSPSFQSILQQHQISFYEPVERQYETIEVVENTIFNYQFALKHASEDMEIRYAVDSNPFSEAWNILHITSMALASSISTNNEEALIAVHKYNDAYVKQEFGADWARMYTFKPKENFCPKQYCKMLALHSEGKPIVYIFYLFDQITEEVDREWVNIRFD